MVSKDKVTRLRMKLAEGGLPKGGGVGYEIFDKSDALGTTSFVQNINHLRALEGELARTIRAIDRVQAAGSIWCCRSGRCFRAKRPNRRPRSWSGARHAGTAADRAIRHLVASAVNGLKPQRVSIVDETGKLLADGAGGDNAERHRPTSAEPPSKAHAQRGRGDRLFGGRRRPRPRPALGRFRLQQDHPDLGQVRSRRPGAALEPDPGRIQRDRRRTAARSPSTTNCRATSRPKAAPASRDQSKKTEEINNYEISRTTKTEVTEAGRVNRISVAVLVDGSYTKNDKGEMVYAGARQGRARPHRGAGALGDRLRPEARRPGRGRQSQIRRTAPVSPPIAEPTG
jgi:flagellar M-ring protein FliF